MWSRSIRDTENREPDAGTSVQPAHGVAIGPARLLALQALVGNSAVTSLVRPVVQRDEEVTTGQDTTVTSDAGPTSDTGEADPLTPPPYGSAPVWTVTIPMPPDGSRGGWRWADWFMGWRRFPGADIRCDFEVGTPLRTYRGVVTEEMATAELRFAMERVGVTIQAMLDDEMLNPSNAPLTARRFLSEEMSSRIPGSRVGAIGSTRFP